MSPSCKKLRIKNQDKMTEIYRRAETFEHESVTEKIVLNSLIFPHWICNSNSFWYIRKKHSNSDESTRVIKEFRLVNAETKRNCKAFDHQLLAKSLSKIANQEVDGDNLPITKIRIELSPFRATFEAFNQKFMYDALTRTCEPIQDTPSNWLISPDGNKAAFLHENNLWVRNLISGQEYALTHDGTRHWAYATKPERLNLIKDFNGGNAYQPDMPEALWSPDSKKLLTLRNDERRVLTLPVTRYVPLDGSVRPQCISVKYALPGDTNLPEFTLLVIDVETGEVCKADHSPILDTVLFGGLFSGNRAWWSADGAVCFFIDMARGQKEARVIAFDALSGECRLVFEEKSTTFIDLAFEFEAPAYLIPLPETGELIWFSQRSGFAHLYLYDLDGSILKNPITEGHFVVREILHCDPKNRELLLLVAGRVKERDPYYREICKVNIDSGDMEIIASGDHDYIVTRSKTALVGLANLFGKASMGCSGVSPNGRYLVTTRSRADQAPVTELIDREGTSLLTVEKADLSRLPDTWQWPEPVKLLGADGKTDIYGLVFKPTDFSPDKKYPVLDWAGTNCFYSRVPKGAFHCSVGGTYMSAQAYAELGFITVMIDGRGSCYRSKWFHDEAYGRTHKGSNLDDHVSGIQQLSKTRPYMDLDHVGITDNWGSNAPVLGLLEHADFYHVGTACSIWDVRLLTQGEIYQGLVGEANYQKSELGYKASNLKGKLLLMQGMLDPYFHTSGAFQLIDKLIRENKDFDFILLPNGGHALESSHYGLRRSWDYLVSHLQGNRPPADFQLSSGFEFALNEMQKT